MTIEPTVPPVDVPRGTDGLATTPAACSSIHEQSRAFLETMLTDAGAQRLVVGLDGGVGAALSATLAVEAVGESRVTAFVMPAYVSHEAVAQTAQAVASTLGIEHSRLQLHPVLAAFQETIADSSGPAEDLIATTNALSRLRMACLYYAANATDGLVVGAADRTQYLLGSVTKHGETGADCLPLAGCYRTEVRALAEEVGLPEDLVVESPGSPLYPGTSPIGSLEVDVETVDRILRRRIDDGREVATVAEDIGVEPSLVEKLESWCARTAHKRRPPRVPSPADPESP
ncbi:NAD(+) synthase [Natrarchaeobaculum aegyptiacum]|uniref:NH(3)-dependent NAD(+) synthetase n=1 Tax=Natrarchaeobaculum aegyptiacum TaxID=745377 RepID=A0A2Z2HXK9_9EURY|nr:NAD(+) synthase [Natrarchaeobaculum aegyptiacum]ARS90965.1 NAD(+) synthase [Natrarchaeobaculum aegyptiacum]